MKLDHNIKNLLLQKITGLSIEQLFLKWENLKLTEAQNKKYNDYISRLDLGEPIEYIIKNTNFYSINFYIDSRVLIPRDDTEIIVEKALETKCDVLIDVWTWSSCIPISILKNNKNIEKCFVIDISKEALEVSKINIEIHKLENKIIQIHWSLLDTIKSYIWLEKKRYWNLVITANLPYIKNWDFINMDEKIIKFEPDLALYGWEKTGFELYEKLIYQTIKLKEEFKNIVLFIEIGFDQKNIAKVFLKNLNLKFEIFKDNIWIDRCVKIYL